MPRGRIELLARTAATSKAQALSRMGNEARLAHLVAFMSLLEVAAVDDVLDEFDVVVGELLGKVERKAQRERLRSLGDLDAAALSLSEAFRALRHAAASPEVDLRRFFLEQLPHARLVAAAEAVASLVTTPEDNSQRALVMRYGYVRRFLPLLLQAVGFDANDAGQPVLKALGFLRRIESERPRASFKEAPTGIVTGSWRRAILVEGGVDHRAYTLCTIQRLRAGLRRRDVFVPGSGRWADPRAQLLSGTEWEATRDEVCRSLQRSADAAAELDSLAERLDAAYRRAAARLPDNDTVAIVRTGGRDTLKLTPLDRLEEPTSLIELRKAVQALLPRVDLPEVLLEVATRMRAKPGRAPRTFPPPSAPA